MIRKIKKQLFILWWRYKNRRWNECRHKRKALQRELRRRGFSTDTTTIIQKIKEFIKQVFDSFKRKKRVANRSYIQPPIHPRCRCMTQYDRRFFE